MNICLYRNPKEPGKVAKEVKSFSAELTQKNIPFFIADQLNDQHPSAIYAIGGDGTFHRCINENIENKPIYFIQSGTGNDWIKNFEKKHPLTSQMYSVDALLVNHHKALNSLGVGFDALIAKKSFDIPVKLSAFKYVIPVLRHLFFYKEKEWELTIDNQPYRGKFFMISIGNGAHAGGGFKLFPQARIDDGKMDVLIIKQCTWLQRLTYVFKVMRGRHHSLKVVHYFQCHEILIKAKNPFHYQCDGELYHATSLHIQVAPLSVLTYNKPIKPGL